MEISKDDSNDTSVPEKMHVVGNEPKTKETQSQCDRVTRLSTQSQRSVEGKYVEMERGGLDMEYQYTDGENDDQCVTKQLKMLSFGNPGKFMDNFDPERSAREMRKMNRKIYREKVRANQMYDESGRLLENSQDLCDCLDIVCPGCHFPCPRCGSEKCGTECRCVRRWIYETIEVEGTNCVIEWPLQKSE